MSEFWEWWEHCRPTKMTRAGEAVLRALLDCESELTTAEILEEVARTSPDINPSTVRSRLSDCLRLGAVRKLSPRRCPRYRITPAGDALLQRIWGA